MTMNAMSCELFNDRLMDYLEHETDDVTKLAIERHAVTCSDCGALLADLRKLRVDSANMPQLVPSHDLWTGIAARIEAPVVSINGAREARPARVWVARKYVRGALIAASLVGAAGIGYVLAMRRVPEPMLVALTQAPETVFALPSRAQDSAARATQQVAVGPTAPAQSLPVARTPVSAVANDAQRVVDVMQRDYDREITRLRVLIDQRRNQMDPVTVAIIEKNLQVIDAAIAECKKAIARDPASRFLIESLNQSLQTKVELMRTAALLPTRT